MALYRNARRLHPYATCDNCPEYRRAALRKDKKTGGYICRCCAAIRAKPNRKTIPACPKCGRMNAPFEEDHKWGRKAQTVFSLEGLTEKICLNCHTEKSKRDDALMKAQAEFLPNWDSDQKSPTDLLKAALFLIPATINEFKASEDNPQLSEELRDLVYTHLRKRRHDPQ